MQGLRLKEQAQLLLDQNENLINEMVEKVKKSEQLIERAQDQQAATAELLAELDGANARANDAVKRGDQTLKEAQETLKKLGGIYRFNYTPILSERKGYIYYYSLEFDAEVQRERIKAQDALKDIKDIEALISNAINQAVQAKKILSGSEDNAKYAREIAQNAQVNNSFAFPESMIRRDPSYPKYYFSIRHTLKKPVQKRTLLELKQTKLK